VVTRPNNALQPMPLRVTAELGCSALLDSRSLRRPSEFPRQGNETQPHQAEKK